MIFVEPREVNIVVVKRGGIATRADQGAQLGQSQVRPMAQKKVPLDVQREKKVFLDV